MKSNIYNPPIKMDGEVIYSIRNYAVNLDDLENVEGFNNSGRRDQLYCFQLNNKKVYVRKEIPINFEVIKNIRFILVEDDKLVAIPLKYDWEIDLLINNFTYTNYHREIRILNSGKIMGVFVSVHDNQINLSNLEFVNNKYSLASQVNKEAHFVFHSQTNGEIITNPPVGSTIIIEGIIRNSSVKKKEILPGLLISALICLSGNYDFRIILVKEEDKHVIKFITPGVTITQVSTTISLAPIKIHDFYNLCCVRLTTQPVNDYEIKFL